MKITKLCPICKEYFETETREYWKVICLKCYKNNYGLPEADYTKDIVLEALHET